MKKIVFVCTGNTCRSPMAEAIAKKLFSNTEVEFSSYGLAAFEGQNVSEQAIKALEKYNVSYFSHTSKNITSKVVEDADLILTMTRGHKAALIKAFPKYKEKFYTLMDYTLHIDSDVYDPYGHSEEVYELCCGEIYNMLKNLETKV